MFCEIDSFLPYSPTFSLTFLDGFRFLLLPVTSGKMIKLLLIINVVCCIIRFYKN